ncbi:MAG: glycosyltransferase, partial [Spirochaetota bacterium]
MRIAYLHHHLRPGGVTRVMLEQVAAAAAGGHQALIIAGEEPRVRPPCPVRVAGCVAYDRDLRGEVTPASCARSLLSEMRAVWPGGADILHVHNPTLGKNRFLLDTLRSVRDTGLRVLLQIHDFAEDGRPENYRPGMRWPDDCHYAVLNARDHRILRRAGLSEEGLHLLPNPVRPLTAPGTGGCDPGGHRAAGVRGGSPDPGGRHTFLYPVRAIRRKNIGEAVLLSLFLQGGDHVGVTLEPTGSLDVLSYCRWRSLVAALGLHVRFGVGVGRELGELLGRARCMITTSIKEGFGFAFLEAWTAGLMLLGRRLPGICDDFVERGLRLSHLYERLVIPLSFIDLECFRGQWMRCFRRRMERYGLPQEDGVVEELFETLTQGDVVDFGMLSD